MEYSNLLKQFASATDSIKYHPQETYYTNLNGRWIKQVTYYDGKKPRQKNVLLTDGLRDGRHIIVPPEETPPFAVGNCVVIGSGGYKVAMADQDGKSPYVIKRYKKNTYRGPGLSIFILLFDWKINAKKRYKQLAQKLKVLCDKKNWCLILEVSMRQIFIFGRWNCPTLTRSGTIL